VVVVENIDQKDFEKMLHDKDAMVNPVEKVKMMDRREEKNKMDWNLLVDLN
jgi:hypothetical protein